MPSGHRLGTATRSVQAHFCNLPLTVVGSISNSPSGCGHPVQARRGASSQLRVTSTSPAEHLPRYRPSISRGAFDGISSSRLLPVLEVRLEADRLRNQRDIDVTCLPDQVPQEEILRLHGSARVSVAISIGDGISTALLEAMAMGSFPIQTCTACAEEWIVDGKSGFIVRPDQPEQIAQSLAAALSDDKLVDDAAILNRARITATASRDFVAATVRDAYSRSCHHAEI